LVGVLHRSPSTAYFDTHGSQAAKNASSSRDKLIDLFNRIEHFFGRLEIYTGITPTTAMRVIIIDIMVEVLTILGIVTKEVKSGGLGELMPHRLHFLINTSFRKVLQEVGWKHGHRG
jgi:hypothetical protein